MGVRNRPITAAVLDVKTDPRQRKPGRWLGLCVEMVGVVEVKVYENEGHGFARRENDIDAIRRAATFLESQIKNT